MRDHSSIRSFCNGVPEPSQKRADVSRLGKCKGLQHGSLAQREDNRTRVDDRLCKVDLAVPGTCTI